jgi:uncharacterized protein
MTNRIQGIDFARSLAIFGMIIINFKLVFHANEGSAVLVGLSDFLAGKAAALFVVLAGVGVSLSTNRARLDNDLVTLKKKKKDLLIRALILFVIGTSYIAIWPADILHFYGVYILIGVMLFGVKDKIFLKIAMFTIALYSMSLLFLDYEVNWNFETFEYANFWTFSGFFTNLFFNGFHPVIPWVAFLLLGMWLGRLDLSNKAELKKILIISVSVFLVANIISHGLVYFTQMVDPSMAKEDIIALFGTTPMPPMIFYMISGASLSITIIILSIMLGERLKNNFLFNAMSNTGKLAMTFYVAHVIIGMGLIEELYDLEKDVFSVDFSVYYALVFSFACIIFANIWLKFFRIGPLEYVFKWLASPKSKHSN